MYNRTPEAIKPTAIEPVQSHDFNPSEPRESASAAVESQIRLLRLLRDVESGTDHRVNVGKPESRAVLTDNRIMMNDLSTVALDDLSTHEADVVDWDLPHNLPMLRLDDGITEPQEAFQPLPLKHLIYEQEEIAEEDTPDIELREQNSQAETSLAKNFASPVIYTILLILLFLLGGKEICLAFNLFNMPVNQAGVTKKYRGLTAFQNTSSMDPEIGPITRQTGRVSDDSALIDSHTRSYESAQMNYRKSDYAAQSEMDAVDNTKPYKTEELKSVNGYQQALPGYVFQFPKDHGSHDQFKTEWWYYSGHLRSKKGKTYGFELTFFRLGGDYEARNPRSAWKGENYKLAHFALTDESGKSFFEDEKISHGRATAAGASRDLCYVHNQGWSVTRLGEKFVLEARSPEYAIHLLLDPQKPPVLHGVDGYCRKSERTGEGTLYYSMTHLKTNGLLFIGDTPVEVTGLSWMDHEFGSYKLTPEQTGWDWYSLQLDDNRELMLCMLRRLDGSLEPASMGTIVDAHGNSKYLSVEQFAVTGEGTWHSERSGGTYPMGWHVFVPGENLDVNLTATVKDQELNTSAPIGITYWEGAVRLEGTSNGKRVKGQGYVEMVGYSEACKQSIF